MTTSFACLVTPYNCATRTILAPNRKTKPAQVIKCSVSSQKWSIQQNLSAVFEPSTYHEHHHINLQDDELLSRKHAQKLLDIGNLLKAEREDSLKDLMLVDAIQRLGIDHHFQEEIEAVLWRQRMSYKTSLNQSQSLLEVSLSFRLLRQEGYYVPPDDVFSKFMNQLKGGFNLKHGENHIKTLMGLYEASQLSMEGEYILDEAEKFSSQLLNAWMRYLDDNNSIMVKNTLRHPYRKSLARFKSMNSLIMTEFHSINGLEKNLRELSYVDVYMAQGIHRQELLKISQWWKDLGIAKELKKARDQPLKWYTWPMAILDDLTLSDERVDLTKIISFIYIIDDIFDLYGKPEDLTLFTQAVNRWELAAVEELPDYMKKCFRALYDITNEAGNNIQKKHGFNPIESLQKTWGDLCNAFLIESRWFSSGSKNLPKADEYLKNAKISSGVQVVLVHVFFLLGFGTTKDSPFTLDDASGIIFSVAAILRLWDDLGSAMDEEQNGHDGSYINYYVKEHQDVKIEIAREHVINMISDEWKRLNMECLGRLNRFSSSRFQKASLNLARMVPLMYSYDDNGQLPNLHDYIKSMLYDDLS